ncbi:uncharacterized protein EI90DRAFT_452332 [Cantharellus anzutake]|uniref:uncharacterized protein n=1 Tax=Cantharellus anzutake TaxID=1750568 RepID=UPI001908F5A0|nr:uncharacterized protein EI90DRAFT_452332 [Cantharellus anzutake]KAF8334681.1 hypothetical protein EI90DRAFT_452332 [Cantharellus anzutake]
MSKDRYHLVPNFSSIVFLQSSKKSRSINNHSAEPFTQFPLPCRCCVHLEHIDSPSAANAERLFFAYFFAAVIRARPMYTIWGVFHYVDGCFLYDHDREHCLHAPNNLKRKSRPVSSIFTRRKIRRSLDSTFRCKLLVRESWLIEALGSFTHIERGTVRFVNQCQRILILFNRSLTHSSRAALQFRKYRLVTSDARCGTTREQNAAKHPNILPAV